MKAPTIEELKTEVTLLWYRVQTGGGGPSKFREVWKREPVNALVYQFSQPVLPEYRKRRAEIVAWLEANPLPKEVTDFDPTGGGQHGDPACCDMDPVYYWDQDGALPTAKNICGACKRRLLSLTNEEGT